MTVTNDAGSSDRKPSSSEGTDIGEVIQLVKDYARQETIGPLRGAGRWLGFGIGGAICLAIGSAFAVLGVLRLLQTETADTFRGRWMQLLPYLIALLVALLIIVVAVLRISRPTLQKKD